MGADAQITLARLTPEGLKHYAHLAFEVTAPVAILPTYPRPFGRWLNLHLHYPDLEAYLETFGPASGGDVLAIHSYDGELIIGVSVLPRKWFGEGEMFSTLGRHWRADRITPGGVPWEELLAAWNQITPGWWVVKQYVEHGGAPGSFHFLPQPRDCPPLFDVIVKWMFWT